jgi:PAS domain S-box-containing protein
MAPDPIYLNDAEGTFLDGNQAAEKLLGIERRKYVGRAFHEMGILPPEELPKAMELLEANRRGEPTGPDEINLITAKGQRVTVEIMTQPMKLGDRELILCMARDISVRKHLEARLAQAQRMDALGTLSSGIAHDFNNILAAILGYAELALDETPSDLPVRQNLEVIAKSAAKARNLVRQILTFSRNVEVQKRPLSIDRVAKEAAAILERTLPKMITLELDLQDDLRPVVADPQQMEQVFINLATNAADAMERGGTISISVRNTLANNACPECGAWLAGPHVELSVSDQGAGISPEVQKKIFEPFFTTKGVGKGTGLGLSTVYGIVSGHGGHICCRSQEGQGTEFAIYLPVAEEAAVNAGSVEQDDSKGLRGSGTILVVDDEDAVRDIAEKMLNRFGYQVLAAASGEQALETYRERRNEVDLVLMDLGMPGMGGKACLEEIRRLDPDAKVLIASGYIQYEATDEWESLGAAGMVPKPYGRADILKAIKEALGS